MGSNAEEVRSRQSERVVGGDELLASDVAVLDLLRQRESMTVAELGRVLQVTPTAVRQRLTRLMAQGFVDRVAHREGRGRPSHQYHLTTRGRKKTGANFGDLAIALWQEVRSIQDPEVKRGLVERISKRMAEMYASEVSGQTLEEKMESLSDLLGERRVPFSVERRSDGLPVLTALACPYPDLAEQDRAICAMENLLFAEILGEKVRLTRCRLDGQNCCTFETLPRGSS